MDKPTFVVPEQQFGAVLNPSMGLGAPLAWARDNRPVLEKLLLEHGAVFFRDFNLSVNDFEALANICSPVEMDLKGGNSPRKQAGAGVYLSTEYPPHIPLQQHHERSFARRFPRYIAFYCQVAPQSAGETPICSSRRLMQRIDPAVVAEFERREVQYLRRYTAEGLPWQRAYDTTSKEAVEAFCKSSNIQFRWEDGGNTLETIHVAQGVVKHPVTHERIYFNQSTAFHESKSFFKGLTSQRSTHARWGDGQEIDQKIVDHICQVFAEEEIALPWKQGDAMLLDNLLATHGRRPFTGPRTILVAIRQPVGERFA